MKFKSNYNDYRADIDGLRAIAVLSVIIFHINESLLPGGFIGVDIFFVISGYLISLHIFKDLEKGRFSIVEFYRRRVKRIAPAMLVIVIITIIFSQLLLLPQDAEKAAESGLWSLFSLANVYFWLFQDTTYFAPDSSELPFLHLWSLGVEEQFYIFWPLILLFTFKIGQGKYFFGIFLLVTVVSFLLGENLFESYPSFTYYMLPTRAGELLIGALIAHVIFKRGNIKLPGKLIALISWSGLLLIAGSLAYLSEELVFPGLWAVPPVVGAGMLIFAGHYGESWATRLLMVRPFVWIGLISYSAYLWHWPILAFLRYSDTQINLLLGTVCFAMTILLAWLSYRYVETPARRSSATAIKVFTRQFIIPAGVIASMAIVALNLDGYGFRWFSDDYKSELVSLQDQTKPAYMYKYVCQRQLITANLANNAHCVIGDDTKGSPKAILWGDSNAAHYIGVIGTFAREGGFLFRNLEVGSCPPLSSDAADFVPAKRIQDCRESQKIALDTIDKFPIVIISASWTHYQRQSDNFLDSFFKTVLELTSKGKLVIIVGRVPIINTYDRLCREKAISMPFMNCNTSGVPLSKDIEEMNNKLKNFAENTNNVEYYDITKYLCKNNRCSAFSNDGKPIYYDTGHLSLSASWQIGADIYQSEGVPFPFTLIPGWPTM